MTAEDHEKLGGRPASPNSMEEFRNMFNHCGLIDAGFNGSKYTWCNNQQGGYTIWACRYLLGSL